MAKPDQLDQESTTTESVSEPSTDKKTSAKSSDKPSQTTSGSKWIIYSLMAFVATFGVVAIVFSAQNASSKNDEIQSVMRGKIMQEFRTDDTMPDQGRGMRGGMMGRGGEFDVDMSVDTYITRVNGVVTAVDGSIITVAGNGTTTKVVVSDDTIFIGDDKPAMVNDTIMAIGTLNGDTFTASRIVLQRQ